MTREEKFSGFKEFLINYYSERLTINENHRMVEKYSKEHMDTYDLRISTKDFNKLIKSTYKSFTDHIEKKIQRTL